MIRFGGGKKRGKERSRGVARWALAAACAAGAALAGACGTTSGANPFEGGGANTEAIQIAVQNQQFNEARLTAIYLGGRRRIGTVGGNQRESFTIPWTGSDQLRIEIDLLAGQSYVTRSIAVEPGAQVALYIENPIHRSYIRR